MEELIYFVVILSVFSFLLFWFVWLDVFWYCVREDVGLIVGDKIDVEGLNRWLVFGFKFFLMVLDLNFFFRGFIVRW